MDRPTLAGILRTHGSIDRRRHARDLALPGFEQRCEIGRASCRERV